MKPDKSRDKIELMFNEISGSYDFLNHFFSMGMDKVWRTKIRKNIIHNNYITARILDLASGTGDLTIEFLKLNTEKVYSCDISEQMLEIQSKKIRNNKLSIIQASAENLPLTDNFIDITGIAFGIRNFENIDAALDEIKRVLRKDGYLIIIDMFNNASIISKLFNIYFSVLLPKIGNLVSRSKQKAYTYLSNSVKTFYNRNEFIELLEKHSFKVRKVKNNFLGIVLTFYLQK